MNAQINTSIDAPTPIPTPSNLQIRLVAGVLRVVDDEQCYCYCWEYCLERPISVPVTQDIQDVDNEEELKLVEAVVDAT